MQGERIGDAGRSRAVRRPRVAQQRYRVPSCRGGPRTHLRRAAAGRDRRVFSAQRVVAEQLAEGALAGERAAADLV